MVSVGWLVGWLVTEGYESHVYMHNVSLHVTEFSNNNLFEKILTYLDLSNSEICYGQVIRLMFK
jgi:hypothetical protein